MHGTLYENNTLMPMMMVEIILAPIRKNRRVRWREISCPWPFHSAREEDGRLIGTLFDGSEWAWTGGTTWKMISERKCKDVEIEKLRAEVAELKDALEQKDIGVDRLRVEHAELITENEKLRAELEEAGETIKRLQGEIMEKDKEIAVLRERFY